MLKSLALLAGIIFGEEKVEVAYPDEYVKYEYVIEVKEDNRYYGKEIGSDNGIYFTESFIMDGYKINEGDYVEAVYDAHDMDLVSVEKIIVLK